MKIQKPIRRMVAVVCMVALFLAAFPTAAGAETAAEKYKRLTEELKATREAISGYKDNISKQQQLKAAYEEEKILIDQLVEVTKGEIERTEAEISHKQEQVAIYRQAIYESDTLLQQRLIAIYNMNNASTLSRLLSVDNISDFFTVMDAIQRISQHDTELLGSLSEQRTMLEGEQAEIDTLLAEQQGYYDDLVVRQEDLTNNIMSTDASISRAQAELKAQQAIEGDTVAALEQAQREMRALAGSIGGSSKGDGSEFVGGAFQWPVPDSYRITCEFGAPDPTGAGHRGMDIGAPSGTPIYACGSGTVIVASYAHNSYGNYLVIDHGDGIKTLYAHCTSLAVGVGTQVETRQMVATVGSTGFSTGPHLHLEVHNGGGLDNPRAWLQG